MRVLEVTHRYPPALGGVERHVEAIGRRLVARGHLVDVVTTDVGRDRPFARIEPRPGGGLVNVRRHRALRILPAPHGLGIVAPGMGIDLLTARADVVHAHAFGMAPTWMAAAVRRVRGTPLVVETHFDEGRGTSGWRTYARAVSRFTLGPADRVVTHTGLETQLLGSLGVPPERMTVIPPGIDLSEFSGDPVRTSTAGPVTALFVGRLDPNQKGLGPLIRALGLLPADLGLRLRLVGEDWGGRAIVLRLARELGREQSVTLTGPLPRPELLREYARADLFVLPSLFECTPAVLMEAMASGLPVLTTRVGGIPEVVREGSDALLCPPNDPPALASALGRLTTDRELRMRLGAQGLQNVRRFSWEAVLPKWEEMFAELGGREHAGRAGDSAK